MNGTVTGHALPCEDADYFRFGSWLCENRSAARSDARLIRTENPLRMKESPKSQARTFCCAQTTAARVFTQPGSN